MTQPASSRGMVARLTTGGATTMVRRMLKGPAVVGSGVAFVIGLLAACSAGSGGTTTPVQGTTFTAASYCEQRQARTSKCSNPTGFDSGVVVVDAGASSSSCTKDFECTVAAFANPDAILTCRTNPDCSQSAGDSCQEKAATGSTADRDTCLQRREQCKAEGKSFSDDNCGILPALKPEIAQKILACAQGACDQVSTCFKNVEKEIPGCD